LISRRYIQIVLFRVTLAVLALLVAARASHEQQASIVSWPLAALFAASAAALSLWPLMVPGRGRTLVPCSLGPAFYMAGMFLISPAALTAVIAFSITLADLIRGVRAYRIVFRLSAATLAYVAPALFFSLGPRQSDIMFHPAARAALELVIASAAVILYLLLRSIEMRLEQGVETPRWGAFQGSSLLESVYALVLSVTILVLARIYPALLGVVYMQIGITAWFVRRYSVYVVELRNEAEGPKRRLKIIGTRAGDQKQVAEEQEAARSQWRRGRPGRTERS
jgi:hypothetical protein